MSWTVDVRVDTRVDVRVDALVTSSTTVFKKNSLMTRNRPLPAPRTISRTNSVTPPRTFPRTSISHNERCFPTKGATISSTSTGDSASLHVLGKQRHSEFLAVVREWLRCSEARAPYTCGAPASDDFDPGGRMGAWRMHRDRLQTGKGRRAPWSVQVRSSMDRVARGIRTLAGNALGGLLMESPVPRLTTVAADRFPDRVLTTDLCQPGVDDAPHGMDVSVQEIAQ